MESIKFTTYNKVKFLGNSRYILIPKDEVKRLRKDGVYKINICMESVE